MSVRSTSPAPEPTSPADRDPFLAGAAHPGRDPAPTGGAARLAPGPGSGAHGAHPPGRPERTHRGGVRRVVRRPHLGIDDGCWTDRTPSCCAGRPRRADGPGDPGLGLRRDGAGLHPGSGHYFGATDDAGIVRVARDFLDRDDSSRTASGSRRRVRRTLRCCSPRCGGRGASRSSTDTTAWRRAAWPATTWSPPGSAGPR